MSYVYSKLSKKSIVIPIFFISIIGITLTLFISQQKQQLKQYAATNTTVTIDLNQPLVTSQFDTGATYTENDTIMNSNTNAQQLMQNALTFQNVFIMGWGNGNPEPSTGSYNWSDIDNRVQIMRNTHAKMMISLCCAPDWMKGGTAGQTDWTKLETAPTSAHYQDFANLAKQVAARYPDVTYFQVWNEFKGFYDDALNRWNYEGYTQMYNDVYDAIKSARPDAKIGGPYPAVSSTATYATNNPDTGSIDTKIKAIITYWLANKHGADFMVFDGGPGPVDNVNNSGVANEFFAGQFYQDVINWVRQQPGGSTLPFGWAEWYPGSQQSWQDLNHSNAIIANDLIYTIESGAMYAFPWGISGDSKGFDLPEDIMTSNGQSTPVYDTFVAIKNYFSNGTQLYKSTASSSDVTVMASKVKTMIVNHLGTGQTITVNGTSVTLTPYQVAIIDTPGGGSITTTPSTTISQGNTTFSLTLCPHGMGNCGDNVNAVGIGNTNPMHASRNVAMTILNAANQPAATAQGTVTYNQSAENFQGSLAANTLASGQYLIAVKMDGFLGKTIPGIVTVTANQTHTLSPLKLVAGDVNNDNQLDILDYNMLISCFGSKATTVSCQNKVGADLNDDGTVNGVDYNLFLRELSVQTGN